MRKFTVTDRLGKQSGDLVDDTNFKSHVQICVKYITSRVLRGQGTSIGYIV
jgi:hypothetical protein